MTEMSDRSEDPSGSQNLVVDPIFVVGCPRSGTTLLGQCLAAHPVLAAGDESSFISKIAFIYSYLYQGENSRRWSPLRDYISETELLRLLRQFTDGLLGSFVDRNGQKRFLDHTPWYVRVIPFISVMYPDAKFIHIIRDGRDVAMSLSASYGLGYRWGGMNIAQRAGLWASCVQQGRLDGRELGPGRYYELSYEKLCATPKEVLQEALAFLTLPYDPSVLGPLSTPHARPSRQHSLLATDSGASVSKLTPRIVGDRWPPAWNDWQRREFLRIAGEVLVDCGYSLIGFSESDIATSQQSEEKVRT